MRCPTFTEECRRIQQRVCDRVWLGGTSAYFGCLRLPRQLQQSLVHVRSLSAGRCQWLDRCRHRGDAQPASVSLSGQRAEPSQSATCSLVHLSDCVLCLNFFFVRFRSSNQTPNSLRLLRRAVSRFRSRSRHRARIILGCDKRPSKEVIDIRERVYTKTDKEIVKNYLDGVLFETASKSISVIC